VAFNEETITESLLLKLSERHSLPHFMIRSWSKWDEGRGTTATGGKPTGADWDFLFADWTGAGVTVRVQAKRQFSSGKYDNLDGRDQQIKDLRNNCGTALPIYVFYNDALGKWPHWTCSPSCKPRFRGKSAWGCSFAPVTAIPAKNTPNPSDIKMEPWHCLVCPCSRNGAAPASLPQLVVKAIRSAYVDVDGASDDRFKDAPDLAFETTVNWPYWAELLLEDGGGLAGPDASDSIGNELDSYLAKNGLKGVALIQQLSLEEPE